MSMKLKRRFTELLALCLVAAMTIGLAGCGGSVAENTPRTFPEASFFRLKFAAERLLRL